MMAAITLANLPLHFTLNHLVSESMNFHWTTATADAHEKFLYYLKWVLQCFWIVYVEAVKETHQCCKGICNIFQLVQNDVLLSSTTATSMISFASTSCLIPLSSVTIRRPTSTPFTASCSEAEAWRAESNIQLSIYCHHVKLKAGVGIFLGVTLKLKLQACVYFKAETARLGQIIWWLPSNIFFFLNCFIKAVQWASWFATFKTCPVWLARYSQWTVKIKWFTTFFEGQQTW